MNGKKTYAAAAVAIVTALAGWYTGDLSVSDALQLAFTSVFAGTIRHGISNS
jgi:hypothetical protein